MHFVFASILSSLALVYARDLDVNMRVPETSFLSMSLEEEPQQQEQGQLQFTKKDERVDATSTRANTPAPNTPAPTKAPVPQPTVQLRDPVPSPNLESIEANPSILLEVERNAIRVHAKKAENHELKAAIHSAKATVLKENGKDKAAFKQEIKSNEQNLKAFKEKQDELSAILDEGKPSDFIVNANGGCTACNKCKKAKCKKKCKCKPPNGCAYDSDCMADNFFCFCANCNYDGVKVNGWMAGRNAKVNKYCKLNTFSNILGGDRLCKCKNPFRETIRKRLQKEDLH